MTEYNKSNPFHAQVVERTKLNGEGSTKATYHLRVSLKGSNLTFRPGDAIGVWPENPRAQVATLLETLGLSGKEMVHDPRTQTDLHIETYLRKRANLKRVTPTFLEAICGIAFEDPKERMAFTSAHDICSALKVYPAKPNSYTELTNVIAPLLPRFYSIASSPKKYPEEMHLLVATFSYEVNGKVYSGVGSDFLCNEETETVALYVHPTKNFLLPEDPSADLIMIGPGTGVAPYKAFLEDRIESGATGKNWLFFGECNRKTDYYYESFFEKIPDLKRSLAFSRDQAYKIYVQHKMEEEKDALKEWIDAGAYVYICGDAKRMAKDVTAMLNEICDVKALRKEKRLLLDVY